MDNATALQKFEQHLRCRSPDRSTPLHYVSDVRQFQHLCPKPWIDVTRTDIEALSTMGSIRAGTLLPSSDVSPHRLWRTFATRLINLGVPVTTLQRLLGHRDLGTTQRYAQVMDPTAERQYHQAMAQIESALSLAPERPIAVPLVVMKDTLDNSL